MNIAIITGASSGMGRQFALKLDKLKLDEIWGVALDKEGLEQTAQLLSTPMRSFAVDLTKDGVDVITTALTNERPNVKWLVNAAGYGKFGRYDEIPVTVSQNIVRLNCEALVTVTENCLPYMQDGAKIAEFSSVAAFQPTPYVNVYSATKAFVYNYARALNAELKSRKITVCAVCPYWTKTNFFDRAQTTDKKVVTKYIVMYDPKDVVEKAYKDIVKGKDVSVYGFVSKLQRLATRLLPTKLIMSVWNMQQQFDKRYKR